MSQKPELEIRASQPGEEAAAVDLVNATFESQETVSSWLRTMGHGSAAVNENTFIAQDKGDGRVVGVVCFSSKRLLLHESRSVMVGEMGAFGLPLDSGSGAGMTFSYFVAPLTRGMGDCY